MCPVGHGEESTAVPLHIDFCDGFFVVPGSHGKDGVQPVHWMGSLIETILLEMVLVGPTLYPCPMYDPGPGLLISSRRQRTLLPSLLKGVRLQRKLGVGARERTTIEGFRHTHTLG